MGLPPVFAHGTGLPFSGRDEVFEQLVDAWKRCATGGFEVVLLAGEPGIGKTRLAQELATRVHGGDGIVLGGRSDEDVSVPFQAFGAALDWFVRQVMPSTGSTRSASIPAISSGWSPSSVGSSMGFPKRSTTIPRSNDSGCSRRSARG